MKNKIYKFAAALVLLVGLLTTNSIELSAKDSIYNIDFLNVIPESTNGSITKPSTELDSAAFMAAINSYNEAVMKQWAKEEYYEDRFGHFAVFFEDGMGLVGILFLIDIMTAIFGIGIILKEIYEFVCSKLNSPKDPLVEYDEIEGQSLFV